MLTAVFLFIASIIAVIPLVTQQLLGDALAVGTCKLPVIALC